MKIRQIHLTSKKVVAIMLTLLVVTVTAGVMLTLKSRSSMKSFMDEQMLGIVKTASVLLDGDELASFSRADAGSKRQKEIIGKLNMFSANFDFEYIYIVRSAGNGKFIFIVDADLEDPANFGEEVVYSPALGEAGRGKAAVDEYAIRDEWGNFYTAYCPVMTSDGNVGGIVGIDFDADWYESKIAQNTIFTVLISVLAILAGGGIMLLMTANLRNRFERLNEETVSIASDIGALLEEIHSESGYSEIAPEAKLLVGVDKVNTDDIGNEAEGIEKLAAEVRAIKVNLKKYIAYVHKQAYTDGMTGVGNKTAYLDLVRNIDKKIAEGTAAFSIAVFDVDYLKNTNDEYGHEIGDTLLNGSAECIKNVFGVQNVFRIGGDEFIAVLADYTEDDMKKAFERIDIEIRRINAAMSDKSNVLISFSMGYATFVPGSDKEFKEVFRRADRNMYVVKNEHHKNEPDIG